MKNNLLFIVSILLFSVSFVSCGKDDENEDSNSSKSEIYLDDEKQDILNFGSGISFDERNGFDEPVISVLILGDNDDKHLSSLFITFSNVNF